MGETVPRIISKAILSVIKCGITGAARSLQLCAGHEPGCEAARSLQLCAGHEPGCEAAIHSMYTIFHDPATGSLVTD